MKVLIAPDSFKDALSALQVCEAVQRGVLQAMPDAQVQLFPLSDGGEGAAEVLAWHLSGELAKVAVHDPLMHPVEAYFFLFGENAFVEMAQASGLELLQKLERNPLKTTTFGVGELIMEAVKMGARHIYLAVGGSATNDGGMGMAAALGWQFLDKEGKELQPIGEKLTEVTQVLPPPPTSTSSLPKSVTVLCDVTNPLYGPNGAAHVFAPQKGASPAVVRQLDEGLRHFAKIMAEHCDEDFSQEPGAGAAGGLGFGAMAFLGAEVSPGALTIMELVGFEEVVKSVDLVITGEGKLDGQTGRGKLVAAVCQKSSTLGVPIVAICGEVKATEKEIVALGLAGAVQLREPDETLEDSIARTPEALQQAAYKVLKTMQF